MSEKGVMVMKKSILVTGGCGMIGSNLVKRLVKDGGWDVFVVDNLWRGKLEYLIWISFNDKLDTGITKIAFPIK